MADNFSQGKQVTDKSPKFFETIGISRGFKKNFIELKWNLLYRTFNQRSFCGRDTFVKLNRAMPLRKEESSPFVNGQEPFFYGIFIIICERKSRKCEGDTIIRRLRRRLIRMINRTNSIITWKFITAESWTKIIVILIR